MSAGARPSRAAVRTRANPRRRQGIQAPPPVADSLRMTTLGPRARRVARVLPAVLAYVSVASFAHAPAEPAHPGADPLAHLRAGNERFIHRGQPDPDGKAVADPVAMVLSCADVRMAPELIFAAAPGELFVVRSLGQVVDRAVTASLEHGAEVLRVPLLVVMGHESCAVVAGAAGAPGSALSADLEFVRKAIRAGISRTPSEQVDVRSAVLANVEQVINDLLGASTLLRTAVQSGRLQIVGAYYESGTGRVVFSDPVGPGTSWH